MIAARWTDSVGNAIAPVALAFAVLDMGRSEADIGLVVGSRSLAMLAFLLLGGALADRWPRSVILVYSNVLSGLSQAVIAWLVLTQHASIPVLMILSAVNGAADSISFPASSALVPQTVPRSLLQRANSVLASGTNLVNLLGLVAGAGLVAAVGPGWGLVVNAASFLAAAWFFSRIDLESGHVAKSSSVLAEIREGWTAFWSRTWVWSVVILFMFVNAAVAGAIGVLGPAIADESIGRARWGWVLGAQAGGALVVTLVLATREGAVMLYRAVLASLLTAGLFFVLAHSPSTWPLLLAAALSGLSYGYFGTAWETNLQASVSDDQLSRIYSFDMFGSILAVPIGQVAIGPIAAVVGRSNTLTAAGLIVVAGCVVTAALPSVRSLVPPNLEG